MCQPAEITTVHLSPELPACSPCPNQTFGGPTATLVLLWAPTILPTGPPPPCSAACLITHTLSSAWGLEHGLQGRVVVTWHGFEAGRAVVRSTIPGSSELMQP